MAVVTSALLKAFETSFRNDFQGALTNAPSQFREIATVVPSTNTSNTYGWLGNIPKLREWFGARVVQNIATHGYTIKNKKYENTIGLSREEIEDNNIGIYTPLVQEMGREAGVFPDERIFELLGNGHIELCFDGQPFFDEEHPVFANVDGTGAFAAVSNITDGAGLPWYILDCSRMIKPLIYQERTKPEFTAMTALTDQNVFTLDEFQWGTRLRSNAGFGFWQMAHRSKAELNGDNLWDAIQKMRGVKGDGGKKLGIRPTHLVVPTGLEKQATRMLEREMDSASSNELKSRLKLTVADFLD